MKFVVLFEDKPTNADAIRAKHLPDHLIFLQQHSACMEAAGPLKDHTNTGIGGLWIVDANDEAEVRELVEQDPFWATGLRQSVAIYAWTQVFADHRPLRS